MSGPFFCCTKSSPIVTKRLLRLWARVPHIVDKYSIKRKPISVSSVDVIPHLHQKRSSALVERFLAASQRGEVQALAAVLAEDVSWWADGGGKVYAAPYPLHGRERVLSLLRGLLRKVPSWYPDLHFSSAGVNGTPGILVWSKETLVAIIACEMTEEHITHLYEVINPDKLAYIQRQVQPHR